MNTHCFNIGLGMAVLTLSSGIVFASPPAPQEGVTQEQLILARRKADQADPMSKLPASKGVDPSVVNRPPSLLETSDIISSGKFATLVPKRAILQIPKNLSDRIRLEPGATIQGWSEFYAANRGWITTVEVSRLQAEGRDPIADETKLLLSKSGNLIVATFRGGPISILPPKEPEVKTTQKSKP
ncbi:MAG: hypothetical protein V4689_08405 [Verrucomicrobiota bacterium]